MNKLKKFLEKKKLDVKFKTAGGGHTLASGSSSSQARPQPQQYAPQQAKAQSPDTAAAKRAAAEAALKRMEGAPGAKASAPLTTSQKAIRAQARKELENSSKPADRVEKSRSHSPTELEYAPVVDEAVGGIFFTCELLPDCVILTREAMQERVGILLEEMLSEEPVMASTLMIYTLNSNKEQRQVAIDTIGKYIDNAIAHPDEEKYRKIRLGNKAFQERVLSVRGGKEFLAAVGFQDKMLPPAPNSAPEPFLFLPEDSVNQEDMETAKVILITGEPAPLKLHRDPRILKPGSRPLERVSLPEGFFSRSAAEIKNEQKMRAEEVEKMMSLRTREMRERDEAAGKRKYKYALLRVKFPAWEGDDSSLILQGTFGVLENFSEVREYVRGFLDVEDAPFALISPSGKPFGEDSNEKSIESCGLAPAGVITFQWNESVMNEWKKAGKKQPYLKEEWIRSAQYL